LSLNKITGIKLSRLHLLLVGAIILSAGLLVMELNELKADYSGQQGQAEAWTLGKAAIHLLTVVAIWTLFFSLRARERDQQRLRRSEEKHRLIINHAGEAIFLLDNEGRILEWNKASEQLFGAARRTVLGKRLTEIEPCQRLELDQAMADSVRLDTGLIFEFPLPRPDGLDGLIDLRLSPLPTDDNEGRFVVIARDVTRERQFESRMSQAEKLAGIGQLAAGIAHQLNTPLGSILLSAQMLSELELGEDDRDDVDRIIRQTDQCRQIIKGLLNFARPQSQERSPVVLGDAVHETVYLMEKSLRVAGVEVDWVASEGEATVTGNRNELDQVFFNLLVNAVDAMPDGGRIAIEIGTGGPGEILVSFADSGPGIEAEHRDKVFLPFFTTKDYGKGTGLGLSIVARIMHEHGGRIELDETYPSGARFLLTFPRPGLGLGIRASNDSRPSPMRDST